VKLVQQTEVMDKWGEEKLHQMMDKKMSDLGI
jgi:hypothetical protein